MGEINEVVIDTDSEPIDQSRSIIQSVHPNIQEDYGTDIKLTSDKKYDDPLLQEKHDVRVFTKSTEKGRLERQKLAHESWSSRRILSIKERIKDFYKTKSQEDIDLKKRNDFEYYIDENGTINELAFTQKSYVLHSIAFSLGGQRNRVLNPQATWMQKLANVVVNKPIISASKVSWEDKRSFYTWFPFGVVLNKGRIESTHLGDQGTTALSISKRSSNFLYHDDVDSYKSAFTAVKKSDGYNELTISHSSYDIAGLYINLDDLFKFHETDYVESHGHAGKVNFKEIYSTAAKYGMKVFAFKNGVAHETELDENGKIILGKTVTPEEMLNERIKIPEENLDEIQEEAKKAIS